MLPEVFLFVHPVGSVIGRARLGNFLCIYQNCSIGGSPRDGELDYPVLGDGVLMYAKSGVIGKSRVGSRVVLGAGSLVVNAEGRDSWWRDLHPAGSRQCGAAVEASMDSRNDEAFGAGSAQPVRRAGIEFYRHGTCPPAMVEEKKPSIGLAQA